MDPATWTTLALPDYAQPEGAPAVWELFHENSKTTRYSAFMGNDQVAERVRRSHPSSRHAGLPAIALPAGSPLSPGLREAVETRRSARAMAPATIGLPDIAAMLRAGYGITLPAEGQMPRAFRATPSGGALYPIEMYLHFDGGLYHYEADGDVLRCLKPRLAIADAFVQREVIENAALVVFFTALFDRSVFKYGERGYRFALIEAGHIAQNIVLAATDLGYASVCLGGYFDHEVDALLGIDGVAHATVYALAIGGR